jgi:hypothetical protein
MASSKLALFISSFGGSSVRRPIRATAHPWLSGSGGRLERLSGDLEFERFIKQIGLSLFDLDRGEFQGGEASQFDSDPRSTVRQSGEEEVASGVTTCGQ